MNILKSKTVQIITILAMIGVSFGSFISTSVQTVQAAGPALVQSTSGVAYSSTSATVTA